MRCFQGGLLGFTLRSVVIAAVFVLLGSLPVLADTPSSASSDRQQASEEDWGDVLHDWPRSDNRPQPKYQKRPNPFRRSPPAAPARQARGVRAAAHLEPVANAIPEDLPLPPPIDEPAFIDRHEVIDRHEAIDGEIWDDGYDGYGADCEINCCPPPCGPPGNVWFRAEYLLWWTRGMNTPPLVITGPSSITDPADFNLDNPAVDILFGGSNLFEDVRSGVRLRGGFWLDDCNRFGIEGEWVDLEDEDLSFSATSINGLPLLARPRLNANTGNVEPFPAGNELVGFPDMAQGTISVDAGTAFNTAGVRFRFNLCCRDLCLAGCCDSPCRFCYFPTGNTRFDFLLGYRYASLDESLRVTEDLSSLVPGDPFDRIRIQDNFVTESEFHGTDVGFLYEFHRCRWSLELLGKIALGTSRHRVGISGSTVEQTAGQPDFISDSGVFAVKGAGLNIGNYRLNKFAVMPEFGVTLGYRLNDHSKLTFGYSLIYWSSVVRPGNHYDLAVNRDLVPVRDDPNPSATLTPRRPRFLFNDTGYFAQGLNFGFEYRF